MDHARIASKTGVSNVLSHRLMTDRCHDVCEPTVLARTRYASLYTSFTAAAAAFAIEWRVDGTVSLPPKLRCSLLPAPAAHTAFNNRST